MENTDSKPKRIVKKMPIMIRKSKNDKFFNYQFPMRPKQRPQGDTNTMKDLKISQKDNEIFKKIFFQENESKTLYKENIPLVLESFNTNEFKGNLYILKFLNDKLALVPIDQSFKFYPLTVKDIPEKSKEEKDIKLKEQFEEIFVKNKLIRCNQRSWDMPDSTADMHQIFFSSFKTFKFAKSLDFISILTQIKPLEIDYAKVQNNKHFKPIQNAISNLECESINKLKHFMSHVEVTSICEIIELVGLMSNKIQEFLTNNFVLIGANLIILSQEWMKLRVGTQFSSDISSKNIQDHLIDYEIDEGKTDQYISQRNDVIEYIYNNTQMQRNLLPKINNNKYYKLFKHDIMQKCFEKLLILKNDQYQIQSTTDIKVNEYSDIYNKLKYMSDKMFNNNSKNIPSIEIDIADEIPKVELSDNSNIQLIPNDIINFTHEEIDNISPNMYRIRTEFQKGIKRDTKYSYANLKYKLTQNKLLKDVTIEELDIFISNIDKDKWIKKLGNYQVSVYNPNKENISNEINQFVIVQLQINNKLTKEQINNNWKLLKKNFMNNEEKAKLYAVLKKYCIHEDGVWKLDD